MAEDEPPPFADGPTRVVEEVAEARVGGGGRVKAVGGLGLRGSPRPASDRGPHAIP